MPRSGSALRRPAPRVRLGLAALLAVTLAAGCRAYTPVESASLPTGRPVRVRLTDAGSVGLASKIGPRAESLEGRISDASDSSLTLTTTVVVRRNSDEERWPNEPLTLRRSEIDGVDVVKVSAARTGIFVGAVAAVLLLVRLAMDAGDDVPRIPGGGGGGGGR